MNNYPVCWMSNIDNHIVTFNRALVQEAVDAGSDNWIPLYFEHKPQVVFAPTYKTLTDEEIEECYWGDGYPDNPRHPKEFARAILRKARD